MAEHRVTALELAEQVNDEIGNLTGKHGSVSERTVFRWLSGEASLPQARQRVALEAVTGRTAPQLGFHRRGNPPAVTAPPEDEGPVRRRRFITATTGAALTATTTAATSTPRRVGMTDVERLNAKLGAIVADDNRHGGTIDLERRAANMAREVLNLQQHGTISQRVRGHLYATAASFTSSAMWAAIDGGRLDVAQQHLNHAVTLAGLSGDSAIQVRVWGHAGALYRQFGRNADAMAAAEAARSASITRRDPLYASLTHARMAVSHADLGDPTATLRSLAHAQDALNGADLSASRPPWMGFYDQAEMELLALIANFTLGRWEDAEAHAHRNLAQLRPNLLRNRALANAHLAHAQLGQGALEPALVAAKAVPGDIAQRGGRVGRLLDRFGDRLQGTASGTAQAREWTDYTRSHRRTTA
ncbi:Tat pathway signal protein [Streptomyces sp. 8N616]|uniref:Tat pathway signal protein n=1 Tax=Streptomyces sp. 8N616 TaxID=3457414 RepID=UPI003FD597DA